MPSSYPSDPRSRLEAVFGSFFFDACGSVGFGDRIVTRWLLRSTSTLEHSLSAQAADAATRINFGDCQGQRPSRTGWDRHGTQKRKEGCCYFVRTYINTYIGMYIGLSSGCAVPRRASSRLGLSRRDFEWSARAPIRQKVAERDGRQQETPQNDESSVAEGKAYFLRTRFCAKAHCKRRVPMARRHLNVP